MRQRAVFLDRDGVINQTIFRDGKPRAPDRVEDFIFFPGVKEAVKRLHDQGFLTIVVTNQPDVSRGWQDRSVVEAMNQKVAAELAVHDIKVCYHDDHHGCDCRKPKPGMLVQAAETWNIDLAQSFMVGDRAGDIEAGTAAGCTSILIEEKSVKQDCAVAPHYRCGSLLEATEWILSGSPLQ